MGSTIRDVARRAGVGLGTVSRVLNNSPLVSSTTRQRVLEVIAELNFTPNQVARSLSSGKTLTIGVIAPFFTRPSVVERLRGIEAQLSGSGYNLVVFNVEDNKRRDEALRDIPRKDRADGVLVISLPPRVDEVATLKRSGTPVVLIDTTASGLPGVAIDNEHGGYLATHYLLTLGHRRIGYISDPLTDPYALDFTSSRDRYLGYQRAFAEYGLAVRPDDHCAGLHGRYEARILARGLLSRADRPTAVFAASDTQALGVLEAVRDLGLAVPGDVSVIGFDDIDMAAYLSLTTVRQPLFESGTRGVEILLDWLAGNQPSAQTETLPVELVTRATTAPPVYR